MNKQFLFLFFFIGSALFAQDVIIKKNNEQLKVKVLEIGTKEIRFKPYDSPDGPVISINKSDVKTIKVEGKHEMVLDMDDNPMSMSNSGILDKTSSIKFSFFSPLRSHLAFSYEWMQKPGMNWEVGIGIIGPGVGISEALYNSNPKGAFLGGGPKFLLGNTSDIEIEGAKYAHPLKGRYVKIEAILNAYSNSFDVDTTNYIYGQTSSYVRVNNKYQSFGLNLQYGRQFIVGNTLTLGYYFGIGYGFEQKTSNLVTQSYYDDYTVQRYSHSYFGKDFPVITTMGFRIGYIFKTPSWINNNSYLKNNGKPSRNSMRQ